MRSPDDPQLALIWDIEAPFLTISEDQMNPPFYPQPSSNNASALQNIVYTQRLFPPKWVIHHESRRWLLTPPLMPFQFVTLP